MASDALTVSGVDAFYGDSHVLHGVGFTLRAGELLGLLQILQSESRPFRAAVSGDVVDVSGQRTIRPDVNLTAIANRVGGTARQEARAQNKVLRNHGGVIDSRFESPRRHDGLKRARPRPGRSVDDRAARHDVAVFVVEAQLEPG